MKVILEMTILVNLCFDGDEMLITREQLYSKNDNVVIRLKYGLIIEV